MVEMFIKARDRLELGYLVNWLRFICMEFTAQEIAQKMEISPRTVEAIKDRLMERFGSKNTAGLVFFAVKNNLID